MIFELLCNDPFDFCYSENIFYASTFFIVNIGIVRECMCVCVSSLAALGLDGAKFLLLLM